MLSEAPRQLALAEGDLLPLRPQRKIVRVPGTKPVSQNLEGGAATAALLGVTVRDLTSQLVEVVAEVVCREGRHPHIDTTAVLPRGQTPALKPSRPALPHPVADLLGQWETDRFFPTHQSV